MLTKLTPYGTARDANYAHPADVRLAEMKLVTSDTSSAARIGRGAAEAVLTARANDGSNQGNGYVDTTQYAPRGSYTSEANAFLWQPLTVNGSAQVAAVPHWRGVTAFGLPTSWQYTRTFAAPGPRTSNGNIYKQQARDIVDYVAELDDERKACAVYWAEDETQRFLTGATGY